MDPRDLIPGQTDRNLRLGHTNIILRRIVPGAVNSERIRRHSEIGLDSDAAKDRSRDTASCKVFVSSK